MRHRKLFCSIFLFCSLSANCFATGLIAPNQEFIDYLHIKNIPQIYMVEQEKLDVMCEQYGLHKGKHGLYLINSKTIYISYKAQSVDRVMFHELSHHSVLEEMPESKYWLKNGEFDRDRHEEIVKIMEDFYYE